MRKIREVLRLKYEAGLSARAIARSVNAGRTTVQEYLQRFAASGLSWPTELDDAALESRLFPPPPPAGTARPEPDWTVVQHELRRKGVTLLLLWQEYKEREPDGFQYSWFCDCYRAWLGRQDLVMRQHHRPGEQCFIDYAGMTVPVTDPGSGELRAAQIFVAVLGASAYTYVEATWSQSLPDWIGSHVRALTFFGGVPEILVPDNLKSGISRTCRYEPETNPTYAEMARYYDVAVIPARVRKPRDKALAEVSVQIAERWILARLRHRQFFTLADLNAAIRSLVLQLNTKPFRKRPGSRAEVFATLEAPALKALPDAPYEYAQWKRAKIHPDYHVEVDRHYYSVPYPLVGKTVDVRTSNATVEIFHRGKRVASHLRSKVPHDFTTVESHMPPSHQAARWSPEKLLEQAARIGPHTRTLMEALMLRLRYPQQAFRSGMGILRLAKTHDRVRMEAACARALRIQAISYRSVASILDKGLDRQASEQPDRPIIHHGNIRGPEYFH